MGVRARGAVAGQVRGHGLAGRRLEPARRSERAIFLGLFAAVTVAVTAHNTLLVLGTEVV